MQMELENRLDEINLSKDGEVEKAKEKYAQLFHEKAEELSTLRYDHENAVKKIEQQNRAFSDLEYREKELKTLLANKQACHHREFERTHQELKHELALFRQISCESEAEILSLRQKFVELQNCVKRERNDNNNKTTAATTTVQADQVDSGLNISSTSSTSQDNNSITSETNSSSNLNESSNFKLTPNTKAKRRRGRKKRN
jgi:hypothetical protein